MARERLNAAAIALLAITAACSGGGPSSPTGGSAADGTSLRPAVAHAGAALPPAAGRFDDQIGGAYAPDDDIAVVERDRQAAPVPGRYNICYVNAFQTQPGERAFWTSSHPDLLLRRRDGSPWIDPGWPDEIVLDISTPAKQQAVTAVVGAWIAGCAADGFQAVEPDNLDTWTRSGGQLQESDAVATVSMLARVAHDHGLAIAQKNAGELGTAGRDAGLDFAVAEECQAYDECREYTDVYGQGVIEIEYTDQDPAAFATACAARGRQISVIRRDRDVVPRGDGDYRNEVCP